MAEYPFNERGLRAAIVDLGSTESQIALTLMRGGWRGKRNDCQTCPIAQYLMAIYGRDSFVDVGPNTVSVTREVWVDEGYGMGYSEQRCVLVTLPLAVQRFLRNFDGSTRYGFLEAA